jgi:hypothetical protein
MLPRLHALVRPGHNKTPSLAWLLGIQVVGAYGRDDLTIAVAMALEKDLGGWVPPPLMGP